MVNWVAMPARKIILDINVQIALISFIWVACNSAGELFARAYS
jgi:hypothetical protein